MRPCDRSIKTKTTRVPRATTARWDTTVCMRVRLTSAGGGLVGVADGDPPPYGCQRDVDDVLETLPLELGAIGVKIRAGEHDLRLALHGRVPVVLDGVVRAPRHDLGDLGPLVAELLVLDQDREVLEMDEGKGLVREDAPEEDGT